MYIFLPAFRKKEYQYKAQRERQQKILPIRDNFQLYYKQIRKKIKKGKGVQEGEGKKENY